MKEIVTPNMEKARARQERKAAHRVATGQVSEVKPTGSPGREFMGADQRRLVKRAKKVAP